MNTTNLENEILQILTDKGPLSKGEIKKTLSEALNDKKLQRLLSKMYEHKLIDHSGEKKGRKYFHLKKTSKKTKSAGLISPKKIHSYDFDFFSEKSLDTIYMIRSPIYERQRVSYDRTLLDEYVPNKTFYLSKDEREKLKLIGKRSKGVQPAGTYAKRILNQLLIDLSFNSSRLEGNTFTLADTRNLLLKGSLEGKDREEATMILNHKEAISFLVEVAVDMGVNLYTVTNLHAALSTDLLPPELCGKLREEEVAITGSVYTPPGNLHTIQELFGQLIKKADAIENPFEQSIFLLLHLPYLQPFEDVNKRTSRLACNIPLMKENMSPMSFIDLPKDAYTDAILAFYEIKDPEPMKDLYLWSYERSSDHYKSQIESFGVIEPLRLKYRSERRKVISYLINNFLGEESMVKAAEEERVDIPNEHLKDFFKHIQEDLKTLHEGNLIGLNITSDQFKKWKAML